MITRKAMQNARTRLESKSYKHARAMHNLAAKYDMQEACRRSVHIILLDLFFTPQGKRDCEESSGAKH